MDVNIVRLDKRVDTIRKIVMPVKGNHTACKNRFVM